MFVGLILSRKGEPHGKIIKEKLEVGINKRDDGLYVGRYTN